MNNYGKREIVLHFGYGADQGLHISNCSTAGYGSPYYQNIVLFSSHTSGLNNSHIMKSLMRNNAFTNIALFLLVLLNRFLCL